MSHRYHCHVCQAHGWTSPDQEAQCLVMIAHGEAKVNDWFDGETARLRGSTKDGDPLSRINPLHLAVVAICEECPIRSQCLEQAMEAEEGTLRYGIWGGLTPRQRTALARERRRDAA